MSEERPLPLSQGENTWDLQTVAQILQTSPETISDTSIGVGLRYVLGAANGLTLDVYPKARELHLHTTNTAIRLRHLNPPTIAASQIVFEYEQPGQQLRHLSVTSRGEITLLVAPLSDPPSDAVRRVTPLTNHPDDEAYWKSLIESEPPTTIDEYGFDEAELRRLLDEGPGGRTAAL